MNMILFNTYFFAVSTGEIELGLRKKKAKICFKHSFFDSELETKLTYSNKSSSLAPLVS